MLIKNWINHHKLPGSKAIVCGLGESVIELSKVNHDNIIIYGVNDIESLLLPTYLVVTDNIWSESDNKEFNEKADIIKNHGSHLFSKHVYDNGDETRINTEQISLLSDLGKIHRNGIQWSYQTSVIVALSLAVYMGVENVGIIGLDMYGTNFKMDKDYVKWWNHTHIRMMRKLINMISDYMETRGQHLYNLSPYSRVTNEIPMVDLKDFIGNGK